MDKEQLIEAYKAKILGIRNYKSDKKELIVADLIDQKMLAEFVVEVLTGGSDFTPAGKVFLEKFYGFKELAASLLDNVDFNKTHSHVSQSELEEWLKGLNPMEVITFIEESKGTIKEGVSVRDDLLPPKD